MLLCRDEGKKYGHPYFDKVLNRLNMVKIELLIPLSYFAIVRTSSTEIANIAHLQWHS